MTLVEALTSKKQMKQTLEMILRIGSVQNNKKNADYMSQVELAETSLNPNQLASLKNAFTVYKQKCNTTKGA